MFRWNKMITLLMGVLIVYAFNGCNGSQLSNPTAVDSVKKFYTGKVVSVDKVLINDRKTAMLTGAGIGGAGGAVARGDLKGGLVGAGIGALVGAVVGRDVVAYETLISHGSKTNIAYLKTRLNVGDKVEFVREGDEITHVELVY